MLFTENAIVPFAVDSFNLEEVIRSPSALNVE
jgi:hypothetical protein